MEPRPQPSTDTDESLAAQAARSEAVLNDLPTERQYERSVDRTLDTALVDAIDAAEAAGNTSLATVFRFELGSHYLDCQR